MSSNEARKDDSAKPRYDLLPPEALEALAHVLTHGAARYGDRNFEIGMRWGRVFAAMMRHAWAFWRGQDFDPDSGMPHTWHVLACAAFLVTFEARKIGADDRNKVLAQGDSAV